MPISYTSAELQDIDKMVYQAMRATNAQEFVDILWKEEPFPSSPREYRMAMGYIENEIEKCQPEAWAVQDGKPGSLKIDPRVPLHPVELILQWAREGALMFALNQPVPAVALIKSLAETSCQFLDESLMLVGTKLCFALGAFSVRTWLVENQEVSKVLEDKSLESVRIVCNPEKSEYASSFNPESRSLASDFFMLLFSFSQYAQNEQLLQGQFVLGGAVLDFAKGLDGKTHNRFKMRDWSCEILLPRMDEKVRYGLKI